ncbi:MAG: hypothetical protein VYC80_18440, partial [Planctomycetota bacterium]|nr:hypothetical protein [Planctomycetota bacterium]
RTNLVASPYTATAFDQIAERQNLQARKTSGEGQTANQAGYTKKKLGPSTHSLDQSEKPTSRRPYLNGDA